MKKHFIKTLFFVLAIVTTFSLVACSENKLQEYEKARDNLYAYVEAGEFKRTNLQGEPYLYVVQENDDEITIDNIEDNIAVLFFPSLYYYFFSATGRTIMYKDVVMIFEDYEIDDNDNIIYENIIYERK